MSRFERHTHMRCTRNCMRTTSTRVRLGALCVTHRTSYTDWLWTAHLPPHEHSSHRRCTHWHGGAARATQLAPTTHVEKAQSAPCSYAHDACCSSGTERGRSAPHAQMS